MSKNKCPALYHILLNYLTVTRLEMLNVHLYTVHCKVSAKAEEEDVLITEYKFESLQQHRNTSFPFMLFVISDEAVFEFSSFHPTINLHS